MMLNHLIVVESQVKLPRSLQFYWEFALCFHFTALFSIKSDLTLLCY